jgi:hypothetical protein
VNKRLVRFLLFFAALWLPVQTMAGLAMPLCGHAQEQVAAGIVNHEANIPGEAAMPCHEAMGSDQAADQDACDNCQVCHLASTGFMPSADLAADLMSAGYHYAHPAIVAPRSHVAEPPQHPPRRGT